MLKTTVSTAALAAALLSTSWAQAQTSATPVDEVIVTASRTELEARAVGSAYSVVTSEQLRSGQIIFAKDALQSLPGVQVSNDRPGGLATVSIRGANNDDVLYLIDGIELGDPSTISTQYSSDMLTTFDISRIEVLRGNQSSLYGSDAIGGVVNIITERASEDGVRFAAELEGGSHETLSGGASVVGRSGALDYRLTATGYRHDGPSIAAPVWGPSDEKDGYNRWSVSGRAGYQFSDTLEGQLIGFHTQADIDLDDTGADSFDTLEKQESGGAATVTHSAFGGRWANSLTLTRYEVERVYVGAWNLTEGDVFEGAKTALRYVTRYDAEAVLKFAAGLDFEREESDQVTLFGGPFSAETDTGSAFAEVAARPTDRFSLTLAGRVDDSSRFGVFGTYRVTGAWLAPDMLGGELKLRASVGTGAKAPGHYQLFDPNYGNPGLTVEESLGGDVGADLVWQRGRVEATLFANRVDNEIDFFGGGYINRGETQSQGLELAADLQATPWLKLAQSYTYLDAQVRDTSDDAWVWFGRPRHSATTTVTVTPLEALEVGLRARYRSRNASSYGGVTGEYVVADLLASYQVTPQVEVYGRVTNVFDEDYALTFGEQTLGRSGYVGVRARF